MFLVIYALIFIILHSPIWWVMLSVVIFNFIQTVRHVRRLEWYLEFDIECFKKKVRIMLILNVLCLIFWILQDKWTMIIDKKYRGEGMSMPIMLMKLFCSDFFCVYATWSYVARKFNLVDEEGEWIKSKKEMM